MAERPTDHLQPAGKRRPGEQLTKDNFDDEEEAGYEPGAWGPDNKADEATLKKRKIVRVARRGPGAAPANAPPAPAVEPAVAAAGEDSSAAGDVAPANPFAGRSLVAAAAPAPAANPFAGRSLIAPAAKADDAAADKDAASGHAEAAGKAADAATDPAASNGAAAASPPAAASGAGGQDAGKEEGGNAEAAPAAAPVFGGSSAGFGTFASGGFGGFAGASSGGFGGFGGFGAAAGGSSAFGFGGAGAGSKGMFGAGAAAQPKEGEGEEGSQGGGDDKEAGGVEGEGVFGGPEPAPVVTLEEVPKVTGEEAEEVLLTVDGALFEFDAGARSWHERGRGEFRINRDPSTRAARAVMRERASKRLILNARLYAGMPTSRMAPPQKGVTFAVANVAHTNPGGDAAAADGDEAPAGGKGAGGDAAGAQLATYALRLKSGDDVDSLLAVIGAWKGLARAAGGPGGGADGGGSGEEAV
ncbi:hypothetical protein Rsub_08723 [Raphidocelis subcapitata]|uniref:RanBD1 domain-containing protein n=1 Tax=Raphidocelis subcapitata TaxID=307507 RepID=A0A2V0P787_9CHLO|nr:hypothetical protein Rsub_08723 [Raphidocelis subcapitata]|eukprot:GBF95741.1 hypothetical protein Rsub_08723 [Raphidocelis subcapitata]